MATYEDLKERRKGLKKVSPYTLKMNVTELKIILTHSLR